MDYTTRLGDKPTEAHINYKCPCGCDAGLIYDRESGSTHLGACCCGRLLWVGNDAEAVVRSHFEAGMAYDLDVGSVTLPWGDAQRTVLAVPQGGSAGGHHDHDHRHEDEEHMVLAQTEITMRVRDVVCGMMIDPREAAGTTEYDGRTFYFCALSCKARFDADPARYAS